MRRLRKLLRAPFGFKMLLAEAFFRLLAVSILLRLVPRTRIELHNYGKALLAIHDVPSRGDVCKAVVIAADYVPGATCLVRCLVARAMLARFGFSTQIRIGVLKDSSNLQAHAWLEQRGSVLFGGDVARYSELGNPLQVIDEG